MTASSAEEDKCAHGVPRDLMCPDCLLAYMDYEVGQLWEYIRFLEDLLKAVLGPDWKNLEIEEILKSGLSPDPGKTVKP